MPPAVPAGSPTSSPFVNHTDYPCCGHISEPQQVSVNRVGKADAILYEFPVYLWGWDSERSCSSADKLTSISRSLRRLSDGRFYLACVYVLC